MTAPSEARVTLEDKQAAEAFWMVHGPFAWGTVATLYDAFARHREAATAPLLEVIEAARGENAANFDSEGDYWRGYDQACLDIHARLTAALAAHRGE